MNPIRTGERRRRQGASLLCLLLFCSCLSAAEAYRWQDSNGTTHYSDNPPDTTTPVQRLTITVGQSYHRVASVVDGDTLTLSDGQRVRLLGLDTPEVAHHGRPGEKLGEKARRFLTARAEGKKVRLEFDKQRRDRYGRLLAHLYLADGRSLNAMLLRQGLAHALFKWPNLAHIEQYYALEKAARRQDKGIWALSSYRVRPMKNLNALRNRFVRLRGRLMAIQHKRRHSYLRFDGGLRVAIRQSRLPLFAEANLHLDALEGHLVTLRGWLGQRDGQPYLRIDHPYQIERTE